MSSPVLTSPRAVADKRRKSALLAAIRLALRVESPAVRRNTQTFNRGRYAATSALPDYDRLKDQARAIKERAIERLPELIATLQASVERNGGRFYLARDAGDAAGYIGDVCRRRRASLVVKGKSMTSEEVGLNRRLESAGIEVAETDLAEFILQAADEQPSHIIAPAIHYSRERITELFQRKFKSEQPLDTGEELTRFARERLREKFLRADVGISGANLIAADSGTLVLVESEGNIRMTTLLPPVHIAIAGIEKVVPARQDLAPFIELLAASATGQPMSCYTSIISPPLAAPVVTDGPAAPEREFHLVLVDNGRLKMREDRTLREALYCIRCSACLNSCANFQAVGGHAFGGETYSGGIGGSWEAGTRGLENARFAELCTGCTRCVPACPVRIDVPWLNTTLRQRLQRQEASLPSRWLGRTAGLPPEDAGAPLEKIFFGRYELMGKWGSRLSAISSRLAGNSLARFSMEKLVGLDRRRQLPPFAPATLCAMWRQRSKTRPAAPKLRGAQAVLFADVFTNYGSPWRGLAALEVLGSVGVDVVVSEVSADGRAALSQGLIATAARQAKHTAELLSLYIKEGRDVVVVEPSVLAMFRLDYRRLLDGPGSPASPALARWGGGPEAKEAFSRLREHSFDAVEYLWNLAQRHGLDMGKLFPASRHPLGNKLFYHSHCQQKTIGSAVQTEALLRAAGFDVVTSRVECCGMAGSFGYKKEFYDLSMAVGEDLFQQVLDAEAGGERRMLVAAGTSCQEQLRAGLRRPVFHPMELLAEIARL